MVSRKGFNEETSELTINVHTLIKSTLEEFQVFEELEEEQSKLI